MKWKKEIFLPSEQFVKNVIVLKVTKTQGFIFYLKNKLLEKS